MIFSKFVLTCGSGQSNLTALNSFDNALIDAGIHNLNLVKISSILPPGAKKAMRIELNPGDIAYTAHASITSKEVGTILTTGIAVGIPLDSNLNGVIMEFHAENLLESTVRTILEEMVEEAFQKRKWELKDVQTITNSVTVVSGFYTSFSACVLF